MTTIQGTEERYQEIRSRGHRQSYIKLLAFLCSTNPVEEARARRIWRKFRDQFCHKILSFKHIYEESSMTSTLSKYIEMNADQVFCPQIGEHKPHMGLLMPFLDKIPEINLDLDHHLGNLPRHERSGSRLSEAITSTWIIPP